MSIEELMAAYNSNFDLATDHPPASPLAQSTIGNIAFEFSCVLRIYNVAMGARYGCDYKNER